MKTLCIVPCGKRKIWDKDPTAGPTPARRVYIGPFARKCREYAERFYPSSWCILSAKYGFLFPEDIVPGNYNATFKDKKTNPITLEELSVQLREKHLDVYYRTIVLGGKEYVDMVKRLFPGKHIHSPLQSYKGIGHMMGALNEALRKGIPL